jgi:hypothetical protein
MNLTIKLLLFILCLNLNTQIGKAESFYPPPVEKVKPPVEKKKKTKKKKTKNRSKNKFLFRDSFKKLNHPKNNTLESQQADWQNILGLISFLLATLGLITFIVGAALVNPLIWIIGGAAFFVGYICFLIVLSYNTYPAVVLGIAGLFAVIGTLIFIIGLGTGTLAVWVGGLIFILPLIIWALIYLLDFIIKSLSKKKAQRKRDRVN